MQKRHVPHALLLLQFPDRSFVTVHFLLEFCISLLQSLHFHSHRIGLIPDNFVFQLAYALAEPKGGEGLIEVI
jgi:hypothetical protein